MSDFNGSTCDNCKKNISDWYSELGWLHMQDGIQIELSARRERPANIGIYAYTTSTVLDFCSVSCFLLYLVKQFSAMPYSYEVKQQLNKIKEIASAMDKES